MELNNENENEKYNALIKPHNAALQKGLKLQANT